MVKVWSDLAWNDYLEFFNKHQKDLIKNTSDTKLPTSKSRYEIATNYDELFLSRKDK